MAGDAFDFIVVGVGSAGCCLVNRLSSDPETRVLLLEAGGKDNSPLIKMPIGFTQLMYDPSDHSTLAGSSGVALYLGAMLLEPGDG